ncbi:hypothetical protein MPSEU_000158400 [Mayamaea pseudoterrestris]|nr:hypothetical protein MPSEU_000158400 [Mayamaea pseudoterrestris]
MMDDDEQRKAFQAFMLGGNKQALQQSPSPLQSSPSPLTSPSTNKKRNHAAFRRKYASALAAFDSCFCKHWLDADDQLLACVGSIANLRQRIFVSSRALVLQKAEDANREDDQDLRMRTCYKSHGYRQVVSSSSSSSSSNYCLSRGDLELTLTDELLQHERMTSLARRLISSLHQDQETLGRRLEELLLMLHLDEEPATEFAAMLDERRQLYLATSHELYRKQRLLQQLFDSISDDMLFQEGLEANDNDASPRRVAKQIAKVWSRLSSTSHLYCYKELIEKLDVRNK